MQEALTPSRPEAHEPQAQLLTINAGVARHPDYRLAAPLTLTWLRGEHLAICGPTGAGKTLLADIITSTHPLLGDALHYHFPPDAEGRYASRIYRLSFRDAFGGDGPAFYQLRWNHGEEHSFPTVRQALTDIDAHFSTKAAAPNGLLLPIDDILDKEIHQLSSGELRRFQLAKAVMRQPEILVLDHPYIGLDIAARAQLTAALARLAESGVSLLLLVSREKDIPPFITHTLRIDEGRRVSEKLPFTPNAPKEDVLENANSAATPSANDRLDRLETNMTATASDALLSLSNISIRYGERCVLNGVTWHIGAGEHWGLTGPNGAGKSTLLSLICADNPMAYACDIRLFGRSRGTGESIWDIKQNIGYYSPELFNAFRPDATALDAVVTGLFDRGALAHRATPEERALCLSWLERFGATHLAERTYRTLSSGEQRLVLLIRAFVKSPQLLVLDEPFHGLDDDLRLRISALIDAYMAENTQRTLILISHYREEYPSCIDHEYVLKKHA